MTEHAPLPDTAEAIIAIGHGPEGLFFTVRSVGRPLDTSNQVHHFAKWLSDNCGFLAEQALHTYNLERALAEATERNDRSRLRLLSADGGRLN